MAAKLKIEKRGDEILKKSSPLKLVSQSPPNFAEMILERTTQESFQQSLVEIGSVVSEEKIIGQNRQKFKVHKKSRNIC
jgi:TnpA family transposase